MSEKNYRVILESPFNKKKIISHGLIVVARSTGRTIAVQRKHSVEFLNIINGYFREGLLPFLLSKITQKEANHLRLLLIACKSYFRKFYNSLNLYPSNLSIEYAWETWIRGKERLSYLLKNMNFMNNELLWIWPKGRLFNESYYECAEREFKEEVEINLPPYIHKSEKWFPISFTTMDQKEIESRYWIYLINDEIDLPVARNHPEVESRKWMSLSECKVKMKLTMIPEELETLVKKIM